jgi:hypothetical protein
MIAPRRAVADDAPGLEANRRRRATGSHDPYSKSCSDSESALPGVHNPLEDMMSKSTLTRRALVASTDPCRPRLPELARVAQAAAEPDPAFALIGASKRRPQFMEGRLPLKSRRLTAFEIGPAEVDRRRSARKCGLQLCPNNRQGRVKRRRRAGNRSVRSELPTPLSVICLRNPILSP